MNFLNLQQQNQHVVCQQQFKKKYSGYDFLVAPMTLEL